MSRLGHRSESMIIRSLTVLTSFVVAVAAVMAQQPSDNGYGEPRLESSVPSGQETTPQSAITRFQYLTNGQNLARRRSMLIAHAVMACFVWAFLIPMGGLLLRLDIRSPWIVRIHVFIQIVSFSVYVAAVGLGIFLVNTLGPFSSIAWQDAHPRLGLAVLALACIQPFLGYLHHRMFKHRMLETRQPRIHDSQGQTAWGHCHAWLGRCVIVLGVINGGLGLKLADKSPAWLMPPPMPAKTAYAVSMAVSVVAYAVLIILFERRRRRQTKIRRNLVLEGDQDTSQVEEQKITVTAGHHSK